MLDVILSSGRPEQLKNAKSSNSPTFTEITICTIPMTLCVTTPETPADSSTHHLTQTHPVPCMELETFCILQHNNLKSIEIEKKGMSVLLKFLDKN